jgi:dipeptidyl aminopeptidase/acylaminoacyl peptidase
VLFRSPGPEFSPRISPDGRRLVCLSSPRRGPHLDVYNLMVVDLSADGARARVVFDFHGPAADTPPHLPPTFPLPDRCWRDNRHVAFAAYHGLHTEPQCVDLDGGPQAVEYTTDASTRSPLLPASNTGMDGRIKAQDEFVQWKSSDGLGIDGVLTLPPASAAKPPFKLLVIPHGGPHSRATSGAGFDAQLFAANGYAVFQPNFRGSSGYGLKFLDADRNDFGGGDMRDILTGIDYLVGRGLADRDRQFLFGASYGGFMTAWILGHTQQFRAAAIHGAATDMITFWCLSDVQSWTEWEFGGLPWEVHERMVELSPLQYASKVRTPILVLASLNDRRCPIAMSRMYYNALKRVGVDTEMVVYPDEGHQLRMLQHREDMLRRVLGWFARHDLPRTAEDHSLKQNQPGGSIQ